MPSTVSATNFNQHKQLDNITPLTRRKMRKITHRTSKLLPLTRRKSSFQKLSYKHPNIKENTKRKTFKKISIDLYVRSRNPL